MTQHRGTWPAGVTDPDPAPGRPADSDTGSLGVRAPTRHPDAEKVTGPPSQAECFSSGAERPPRCPTRNVQAQYQHTVSRTQTSVTPRPDTECSVDPSCSLDVPILSKFPDFSSYPECCLLRALD